MPPMVTLLSIFLRARPVEIRAVNPRPGDPNDAPGLLGLGFRV